MGTYVVINFMSRWLCRTRPTDQPLMKLRNFFANMFHMSRRTIQERFIWRSSLQGDRQGLRAPNTFLVQFKGYNSCYRIQNWAFLVPLDRGHRILCCRNEKSYRGQIHIFFKNIIVHTTPKWAPTFSSIYYEQVAMLHRPKQLASNETEEFLPKHVPHVQKDHIERIHLALIPVGRQTGPESPEYIPRAV